MIASGEPFPDFSLEAHDGATVAAAGLRGRPYLLYFYPKAETPVCTREACAFRDTFAELRAAGVEVLGVSFDSPAANRAFAERHGLPFRLLTDRGGHLARATGAKMPLLPLPWRISYLVDAAGRVHKAYPRIDPRRHPDEVLQDARALAAERGEGELG
jgi:peroxiredoxin Q/BCP